MMRDYRNLPPPLPGPPRGEAPGTDLPERPEEGPWHWISPEWEEISEVTIQCLILVPLLLGAVAMSASRYFAGQYDDLFGPLHISFYGILWHAYHLHKNKTANCGRHRGYRVDESALKGSGNLDLERVDFVSVRKAKIWYGEDGAPRGIALKIGQISWVDFWELTDMPRFVEAVVSKLPPSATITNRTLLSTTSYRLAMFSYWVIFTAIAYVGGPFIRNDVLCILLLLCGLFSTHSFVVFPNPRRPSY